MCTILLSSIQDSVRIHKHISVKVVFFHAKFEAEESIRCFIDIIVIEKNITLPQTLAHRSLTDKRFSVVLHQRYDDDNDAFTIKTIGYPCINAT